MNMFVELAKALQDAIDRHDRDEVTRIEQAMITRVREEIATENANNNNENEEM